MDEDDKRFFDEREMRWGRWRVIMLKFFAFCVDDVNIIFYTYVGGRLNE